MGQIKNLKLTNLTLVKENKRLRKLKRQLQIRLIKNNNQRCKTTNLKMEKLKLKKQTIYQLIDKLKIAPHPKTFAKMLINNKTKYTSDEKDLALAIFLKSAAAYLFLRDNLKFKLPALSSIYRWFPLQEIVPGLNNDELFSQIKSRTEQFSMESKDVMLYLDEMHTAKKIEFNNKLDHIEGFVDFGDGSTNKQFGKVVCTFMLRSIKDNWKQVFGFVIAATTTTVHELKKLVNGLILKSFSIGHFIKLLVFLRMNLIIIC